MKAMGDSRAESNRFKELDKTLVLNSITELVGYQDRELRVVWANKAAADAVGKKPEQLIGKHCYEIWAQRDTPCVGCPLVRVLESGKPESGEMDTPDGRHWAINGYPVRGERGNLIGLLEITRETTEQKNAEEAIKRRLDFEKLVSSISKQFVWAFDIDDAINASLEAMGRFSGADRAYVFRLSQDMSRLGASYYWCREGISQDPGIIERLAPRSFPWFIEKLSSGEPLSIQDVSQLPAEANEAREILEAQGVKSLLALPIRKWQRLAGSVGFVNMRYAAAWSDEDVSLLKTASEFIDNALERDSMNRALQESEDKYRAVFENTGTATIIIEEDTTISLVNDEFVRLSGYSKDEVEGKKGWTEFVVKEDLEKMLKYHESRRRERSTAPRHYECRSVDKQGNIKNLYLTVAKITGTGKSVASFLDITERKKMEERNQHLTHVLHAIRNVNQLITKEKDRKTLIEGACRALIETRGYYNAWIVLLDESGNVIDYAESGLGEDFGPLIERMKKGEIPSGGLRALRQTDVVVNMDPPSDCPDCPLSDIYRGRSGMVVRLQCEGETYGILAVSIPPEFAGDEEEKSLFTEVGGDISSALHNLSEEGKRRQAQENLKNYMENAPDGVYVNDLKGTFIYGNSRAEEITGYSRQELIGKSFFVLGLLSEEDLSRAERSLALNMKGMATGPDEYELMRKDGSRIWVEIKTVPLKQVDGENVVVGFVRDITARKKAEGEKRELERKAQVTDRLASVGEMASGVAHEINNPLTSVVGFSELLMGKDLPEDVKEEVEIIHGGAKRVADIVKRLLSFARQQKPVRSRTDINEIVENTLTLRKYALETSNIEVKTVLDPELPWTVADVGQLQQVFMNIVVNAEAEMKKAHGRGRLIVKTEEAGDVLRISFKDDGPGIAKKDMDRIFEPFFTTKPVGEGTGLGLSLAHGIIAEHRGNLYAKSVKGKGATFYIDLPIIAEERQPGMDEPEADVGTREAGGGRILVLDDEPSILSYLKNVLCSEGYDVETVDNGEEALEMIKNGKYRLLLCDIKLPGLSGIELYNELNGIASSLQKRVIFITGDVIGSGTREFLKKTKAPHIAKPIDVNELKRAIKQVLMDT